MFLSPGNLLLRLVVAGEKAQILLHYELCRRRKLPGSPTDYSQAWVPAWAPFGHGSRLQDEDLDTLRSSAETSVLPPVVESEETLSRSEYHRLLEVPGTSAGSP